MQYSWNRDCKEFLGVHTCEIQRAEDYPSCESCQFYDPYTKKILIIKLGAMGDVLRTTPLIEALRKKYGNPYIVWITKEESKELLKEKVDKVLIYNLDTILRLQKEKFHILISLEIDVPGTALANGVNAEEKFGYYLHEDGHPSTYNKEADFYLERALSNHINRENRKTYQEMMFEIVNLPYEKQEYEIKAKEILEFKKQHNIKDNETLIGINIGSALRWPAKRWHEEEIIKFINNAKERIILLAGPEEKELQKNIKNKVKKEIILNNPENTLEEFIAVLNICDTIVTGDTLTLHLAIGLKKKVIALFFCTPPWEIGEYERVTKVVSPLFEKHFYMDNTPEELTKSITAEEVQRFLKFV